ncbi:hypothetical protein BV378_31635 [Nostoc sp. RF31YmG]|nr:hypothetical protein BV378_31635 [Nostoc sp. RF31YmG]
MNNVNQFSFKSTCSQKVIIEELIDSELKGVVGGETLSFSSSNLTSNGTVIIEQSTEDKQTGNQRTIIKKTKTNVNGIIEATEQVSKYVNGVKVP